MTILVQAGLLGAVMFIGLTYLAARRVMFSPPLLAALAAILVYGAGGDIMRRLPVWMILFVIVHYGGASLKKPVQALGHFGRQS